MIAVEFDRYGSSAELVVREVAEPEEPGAGCLRIRVVATSVNPKDTFVRKGRFAGAMSETFPKRVGYDWAGTVEALGAGVTGFAAGDKAFGMVNGWEGGTCAARIDVRADEAARLASTSDLIEAAALPLAAQTALQALHDVGRLERGGRVLVNGASGGVGLFAIAIARAAGANVVAVASRENAELCLAAGAEAFVDYRDDPDFAGHGHFDVVFDVFGNLKYERLCERLAERGTFLSTVPSAATFDAVASTPGDVGRRARLVAVRSRRADLERVARMFEARDLRVHVDRTYPIRAIAAAHDLVERKHTRGKVIVTP